MKSLPSRLRRYRHFHESQASGSRSSDFGRYFRFVVANNGPDVRSEHNQGESVVLRALLESGVLIGRHSTSKICRFLCLQKLPVFHLAGQCISEISVALIPCAKLSTMALTGTRVPRTTGAPLCTRGLTSTKGLCDQSICCRWPFEYPEPIFPRCEAKREILGVSVCYCP
jgi:hypothetical protein